MNIMDNEYWYNLYSPASGRQFKQSKAKSITYILSTIFASASYNQLDLVVSVDRTCDHAFNAVTNWTTRRHAYNQPDDNESLNQLA